MDDDDNTTKNNADSSYNDDHQCTAVHDLLIQVKVLFQDYSFTIVIVISTFLNLLYSFITKYWIPKLPAYPYILHLSSSNKNDNDTTSSNEKEKALRDQLVVRYKQLIFGSWIALSGFSTLVYQAVTTPRCNAINDLYLYFVGIWFIALDTHEYVRRWPLNGVLLAHHIAVFIVTLSYLEWNSGLFSGFEDHEENGNDDEADPYTDWTVILLLSNIGLGWVFDFFHVIFRTNLSLKVIVNWRLAFLIVFVYGRGVNIGLFGYMIVKNFIKHQIVAGALLIVLALAYIYNSYNAMKFAWNFDCQVYYMKHQQQWINDNDTNCHPLPDDDSPSSTSHSNITDREGESDRKMESP